MGKKRDKISDQKMKNDKADVQQKEEFISDAETEVKKTEKNPKTGKKPKSSETEEYQKKIDELNDKFLRLFSEFDNYRKRTSREKLELAKSASEELITDLLPVLDDFERAMKSTEEVTDCEAVKEGMKLIYNKFNSLLTKKGLSAIEATGKDFDTDFHEAITYIPASSENQKGKVIDEVEKGYLLNDKVIRYTKVVIGQ